MLSLERWRVLHVNVTAHPSAAWAAQQKIEAAPNNDDRPHMALDGDAPAGRAIEGSELGQVFAPPRVGGLHHRYSRAA